MLVAEDRWQMTAEKSNRQWELGKSKLRRVVQLRSKVNNNNDHDDESSDGDGQVARASSMEQHLTHIAFSLQVSSSRLQVRQLQVQQSLCPALP